MDMSGRVVVVTGGGKGVGRGITKRFLEANADVVICGREEPESLPAAAGKVAEFVAADVRSLDQIDTVLDTVSESFGRFDILINNAGGAPPAEAATASPRFSQKIIELNLVAPLNFMQRANSIMQKQDAGGAIINIASVSGQRPSPGTAAYGAAKAGLMSLTQSLAVEWAPKVRINAIAAGMIKTEQAHLHYGDEEAISRVAASVPLGRLGEPSDVGNLCLFLASPMASYISGATIVLDGGGEKPAFLGLSGWTKSAT